MKITVALDSFKGGLSSPMAGDAVKAGCLLADPTAKVSVSPIAAVAKKYGKPVLALSGCIAPDALLCNGYGIDAFFPILPAPCTLEDAMEPNNAYQNLKNTAEQALRLFLAAKG